MTLPGLNCGFGPRRRRFDLWKHKSNCECFPARGPPCEPDVVLLSKWSSGPLDPENPNAHPNAHLSASQPAAHWASCPTPISMCYPSFRMLISITPTWCQLPIQHAVLHVEMQLAL